MYFKNISERNCILKPKYHYKEMCYLPTIVCLNSTKPNFIFYKSYYFSMNSTKTIDFLERLMYHIYVGKIKHMIQIYLFSPIIF